MRFLPVVIFLSIALLCVVALVYNRQNIPHPAEALPRPLPEFTLESIYYDETGILTDKTLKLPAIIHLFASWCPSCTAEQPVIAEIKKKTGIPVYGIAWKDSAEQLRERPDIFDLYTAVAQDKNGALMIALGASAVPESFIVNREGNIVYHSPTPITETEAGETVIPLIKGLQ